MIERLEDRRMMSATANSVAVPTSPVEPEATETVPVAGDSQAKEMTDEQRAAALAKYNRMMSMITNLLQMSHEAKKGIIQNFRA